MHKPVLTDPVSEAESMVDEVKGNRSSTYGSTGRIAHNESSLF